MRQLLLLAVLVVPASALRPGDRALSLFGGGAFPGGAMGDSSNVGFSGGAGYRRQFTPRVSAGAEAEFQRFGDQELVGGVSSGADNLAFGLALRLEAPPETRGHSPFLSVGPAFNRVTRRTRTPAVRESEDDWVLGVSVVGGTMWALGRSLSAGPTGRFRTLGRHGFSLGASLELSFALANSAPETPPPAP